MQEKLTFTAGEALVSKRRVKLLASSTYDPPQVKYADTGEDFMGVTDTWAASGDPVAVVLQNSTGLFEIEAVTSAAINVGTVLYGGDSGVVTDAASGTAQGIAAQPSGGADNAAILVALWNVKSTTAATVSVADAGNKITAATVEAALTEAFTHIQSAQKTIPITLGALTLETGTAIGLFVNSASSKTPGLAQLSNKELVLRWNNSNCVASALVAVAFSVPLPQDLNSSAAVYVHFLSYMSGGTDTPELETEMYFNSGDTDCANATDPEILTSTVAEYSISAAAADVPVPPGVLTTVFYPKTGQIATDDLILAGVWLEYTGKTLTS
jgi:hypothetical protein